MAGFPPLSGQGNLNRVATHITLSSYPALNANASYMSKSLAVVSFDGPYTDQIETATGIVNSPKPFVMATIMMNLLRSQSLSGLWLSQIQTNSYLGTVVAYPDSTVFPAVQLTNASVVDFEPGAFDGMDPTVRVQIKGTFYINANLWAALTGSAGTAGG